MTHNICDTAAWLWGLAKTLSVLAAEASAGLDAMHAFYADLARAGVRCPTETSK